VDGREYARRPLASDAQISSALDRARQAQREWALAPLQERCAAMLRFLDAMEALNPLIVPEIAWQMGRPVRYGGEFRSLAERDTRHGRDRRSGAGPVRRRGRTLGGAGARRAWCW
jgi:acyl-CoA reductase-like NAD-dependent aldehyde dehydrogenase